MAHQEVCVLETNGETEARQIQTFLRAHEIPSRLGGESTRITHALTLDGLGATKIMVQAEHAEQARELLARAESGELSLPDEGDGLK